MNIKKVDDKPMVIHTKEKAKLHIKQEPEAKIKGRNVLMVEKGPKIAGADKEDKPDGKKPTMKGKSNAKESVRQAVQKENGVYAQVQRAKQDREKAIGKKNSTAKTVTKEIQKLHHDMEKVLERRQQLYEDYAERLIDAERRFLKCQRKTEIAKIVGEISR